MSEIIRGLIKNLFFSTSYSEEAPLSEAEHLLTEIEKARKQLNYAWDRLNYAAPEYVEIVILELLVIQTQYGLLNKRYRLLLGNKDEASTPLSSSAKALSNSMVHGRQNHAFL